MSCVRFYSEEQNVERAELDTLLLLFLFAAVKVNNIWLATPPARLALIGCRGSMLSLPIGDHDMMIFTIRDPTQSVALRLFCKPPPPLNWSLSSFCLVLVRLVIFWSYLSSASAGTHTSSATLHEL